MVSVTFSVLQDLTDMAKISYSNETVYRIAHVAESDVYEQLQQCIEMAKKSPVDLTIITVCFDNGDIQRIAVEKDPQNEKND